MPIPPAGHSGRSALRVVPNTLSRATKKPGGLAAQPGLETNAMLRLRYVISMAWIAGVLGSPYSRASACTAAPWFGAAGLQLNKFRSFVIASFRHSSPARIALAPKNKKPGALTRSGFSMSDARPTAGRSRRPDERGPRYGARAVAQGSADLRAARPRARLAPALRIQIALLRLNSLCSASSQFNEGAEYAQMRSRGQQKVSSFARRVARTQHTKAYHLSADERHAILAATGGDHSRERGGRFVPDGCRRACNGRSARCGACKILRLDRSLP